MHRLLYISTAKQVVTPQVLDAILRTSRRNNARDDVTGLLIAGGRRFLQALEGNERSVRATFERIRDDPRHFAAVVLADHAIAERSFAQWSMGYQPGGSAGGDKDVAAAISALVDPIGDPTLRGYFTGFAEARAAA